MTTDTIDHAVRDETWVKRVLPVLRAVAKTYFRSEVRAWTRSPTAGSCWFPITRRTDGLDVPVIAVAFAEQFGASRPLYTLAHDLLFTGFGKEIFGKTGFLPARPRTAVRALRDGAATIVFPGGDWEAMRPTSQSATIDFRGRTGYIRTALEAGVPIVPIVTIGGQETQLFLNRGDGLARLLRVDKVVPNPKRPLRFRLPVRTHPGLPAEYPTAVEAGHRGPRPDRPHRRIRHRPRPSTRSTTIRKRTQHGTPRPRPQPCRFPVLG